MVSSWRRAWFGRRPGRLWYEPIAGKRQMYVGEGSRKARDHESIWRLCRDDELLISCSSFNRLMNQPKCKSRIGDDQLEPKIHITIASNGSSDLRTECGWNWIVRSKQRDKERDYAFLEAESSIKSLKQFSRWALSGNYIACVHYQSTESIFVSQYDEHDNAFSFWRPFVAIDPPVDDKEEVPTFEHLPNNGFR